MIYNLIGRLLFSRHQAWEQQRHARTVVFTVTVALALGLIMAKAICMVYRHQQ